MLKEIDIQKLIKLEPTAQKYSRWHYLWAALFFAGLTLIFTWRMWGSLTSAVPGGDIDGYENVWNNYWINTALLEQFRNPYFTDYIYYPSGVSLRLHTLQPLNGLFTIPLVPFFGYIGATNLLFVFAIFGTAIFSYLLFYYLTKNAWASLIGASIFGFCNWQMYDFFGAGQTNLISMQWLPLYLLFMFKVARNEGRIWLNAGFAALFLLFNTLIDLQYLLFAVMFTGLYALYRLITRQSWREKGFIWLRLLLIGVIWGIVALPFVIIPAIVEVANNAWLAPREGSSISKSSDLAEYFNLEWHNLGYFALALVAIGLVSSWRKIGYWIIAATFFGIMSLGTVLQINRNITGIALPYKWLTNLPGMSVGRNPSLFQIAWMLAMAVLACYGVVWLLEKFKLPLLGISGAIAFALIVLIAPFMGREINNYKLDTLGTSAFFEQLAKDNEEYAIFEVPPFTSRGRGENVYQAYQIIHQKPRFSGRMARDHKLDNPNNFVKWNTFFRDFFWLPQVMKDLRPKTDFLATPDYKKIALPLLNFYKVRYIVLYKEALTQETAGVYQALIDEALNKPLPVFEDNLLIAYRVPQADPKQAGIFADVGDGWSSSERTNEGINYRWADSKNSQSELYLYNLNPTPVTAKLEFKAYSFKTTRELIVLSNGQEIKRVNLTEEQQAITIDLELKGGRNLITFATPQAGLKVADFGFKNDARTLTFGIIGINVK
jgi:hypothetical protein